MAFRQCECSSMVEFQPSKLVAWVRFPSLAPITCALSSVDRVPGYEPVGRRFESSRARQSTAFAVLFLCLIMNSMAPWMDLNLARRRRAEGSHSAQAVSAKHTLQGAPKHRFRGAFSFCIFVFARNLILTSR